MARLRNLGWQWILDDQPRKKNHAAGRSNWNQWSLLRNIECVRENLGRKLEGQKEKSLTSKIKKNPKIYDKHYCSKIVFSERTQREYQWNQVM